MEPSIFHETERGIFLTGTTISVLDLVGWQESNWMDEQIVQHTCLPGETIKAALAYITQYPNIIEQAERLEQNWYIQSCLAALSGRHTIGWHERGEWLFVFVVGVFIIYVSISTIATDAWSWILIGLGLLLLFGSIMLLYASFFIEYTFTNDRICATSVLRRRGWSIWTDQIADIQWVQGQHTLNMDIHTATGEIYSILCTRSIQQSYHKWLEMEDKKQQ